MGRMDRTRGPDFADPCPIHLNGPVLNKRTAVLFITVLTYLNILLVICSALCTVFIGVGDGGQGGHVPPPLTPPRKKIREKYFWAIIM